MQPHDHDSFELRFNRVAIAVVEMLDREMTEAFLSLIEPGGREPSRLTQRSAETANRIIVLCRRLVEEIRHFEHCDQARREEETEKEEHLPF